jgi:hypothetical protein
VTPNVCPFNDRVSCSIVNNRLPHSDGIQLYNSTGGGVVVSPRSSTDVFCSFDGDGATGNRIDHGCGCESYQPQPCNATCGSPHPGTPCAFAPQQLGDMLEGCEKNQGFTYNEVVLSGKTWVSELPTNILAFFYPRGDRAARVRGCNARHADAFP